MSHYDHLYGDQDTFNFMGIERRNIPYPRTTMLLFGTGLVGVAGAARRKKKKQA